MTDILTKVAQIVGDFMDVKNVIFTLKLLKMLIS